MSMTSFSGTNLTAPSLNCSTKMSSFPFFPCAAILCCHGEVSLQNIATVQLRVEGSSSMVAAGIVDQ